ncbi:MAG: hypothetical protein ACLQVL_25185 [Terriglobia bacterium]
MRSPAQTLGNSVLRSGSITRACAVESDPPAKRRSICTGRATYAINVTWPFLGGDKNTAWIKPGDTVIKYGEDIGKVVANIQTGQHVHVHNLKTKRW